MKHLPLHGSRSLLLTLALGLLLFTCGATGCATGDRSPSATSDEPTDAAERRVRHFERITRPPYLELRD
ncbi:MAG: hypothetical protein NDI61_11740 [Bdellovibrionaceae bacterium]|nr:hypothetical protein [Pseudobdellovibrionaceae bacterium]